MGTNTKARFPCPTFRSFVLFAYGSIGGCCLPSDIMRLPGCSRMATLFPVILRHLRVYMHTHCSRSDRVHLGVKGRSGLCWVDSSRSMKWGLDRPAGFPKEMYHTNFLHLTTEFSEDLWIPSCHPSDKSILFFSIFLLT